MDKKIGFIGCGNMAKAMIKGIINSNLIKKENIIASAKSDSTIENGKNELKINMVKDNKEVAKVSDIIILATKPNIYPSVIEEIRDIVDENKLIITIAAGKSIKEVEELFNGNVRVIRTMPNTPALVGEGMSGLSKGNYANEEDMNTAKQIFCSFGKCEEVEESLMDCVVGASGSSPAFVYMFIESLADGAVLSGMKRDTAYKFVAQSVLGSAKMVLESGEHPGKLKDNVCSPGGTTIAGVEALEKEGFRGSVIKAIKASVKKSMKMSEK